jgi:uncharacterized protein YyaL (SSP411 family)
METTHTNRLINEASPYLLQHAHNPVDWYPWGEEALQKAKAEDKPILVSIGYAACHWCHVMERESFENEETAALMNKYFVNIKIDREERPDLDHVYMDAVQAISGGGGWPLNVFLTPDRKPFYGGTYYPPVRAFNRMSWTELLYAIHDMFTQKRNEVEAQSDNLVNHLATSNMLGLQQELKDEVFNEDNLVFAADNILKHADTEWGGFGNAPKFPQTFTIQYLLRHYYFTGNEPAVKQALLSLDKMIFGGINDQLGGGFARYSTDAQWLAPHFEKMLYDNALLVSTISEAYQLTQLPHYADAVRNTLAFVERELTAPGGGFFSALDADSEGVEGKFYIWSKAEIDAILGEDSDLFCQVYDVSERGNWEHTNILWMPAHNRLLSDNEQAILARCREKLFAERARRVHPLLDDKILLGWNALMITACCKAYAALGDAHFLEMATNAIRFLEEKLQQGDAWLHSWKENKTVHAAFFDDYAYLVQAYTHLQETTGNSQYLLKAKDITAYVQQHFWDSGSGFFFFTPDYQSDVVVRKKDVYDGAMPSGNSVMAGNLYYLAIVFDEKEWLEQSRRMVQSVANAITRYPTSFGVWAAVLQNMVYGMNEIVITGANAFQALPELLQHFIPNKVVQSASESGSENVFSLLQGKEIKQETAIYVCRNNICLTPVSTVPAALNLIEKL